MAFTSWRLPCELERARVQDLHILIGRERASLSRIDDLRRVAKLATPPKPGDDSQGVESRRERVEDLFKSLVAGREQISHSDLIALGLEMSPQSESESKQGLKQGLTREVNPIGFEEKLAFYVS